MPTDERRAVTPLRLPSDLKDQLKRAAEANRRSLNQEIVFRLMQGMGEPPSAAGQAAA